MKNENVMQSGRVALPMARCCFLLRLMKPLQAAHDRPAVGGKMKSLIGISWVEFEATFLGGGSSGGDLTSKSETAEHTQ